MRRILVGIAVSIGFFLLLSPTLSADTFLSRRADEWARQLTSKELGQRRTAVFALGRIGGESERFLPRLLEQLRSEANVPLRAETAMAMGDIILALGEKGEEIWPRLGPALQERLAQEKESLVRRGLIYALGAFGGAAVPAIEGIEQGLKDPSPAVRQTAAWAVGRLGEKASEESVQLLIPLLKDPTALVRRDAAGALGDIGIPLAASAFGPMLDLVQRENQPETGDSAVLKTALEKLVRLADPGRIEDAHRFHPFLGSSDPEIARAAAFTMARMQPVRDLDLGKDLIVKELKPAVPVLRAALHAGDPVIEELAAAALGKLGPTAAEAVPDLAAALNASDPKIRRNAALALGHIGPEAKPAIGALLKVLTRSDSEPVELRARYAEAISYIRYPANAEAIPMFVEIMEKEKYPELRRMCVVTFFGIDDLSIAGAQDALYRILNETDEAGLIVRYNAAVVLASHLHEKSSDSVVNTLLDMLKNQNLRQDKGTKTQVDQTGGESSSNQSSVASGLVGDGRFIAAYGLGMLRKKGNRPDVIKALEDAAQNGNEKLKKTAREALKQIRG